MKLFVAGGTGVLGRRVVDLLVAAGHQVSVIARTDEKAAAVAAAGATPARVALFDAGALREVVAGHEAVVNLATHIPPATHAFRSAAWTENDRIRTEGSRNLVDAALATGASRYVQESLAFLYPDHGSAWIDESAPWVDVPVARSMQAAEHQAARFTAAGGAGVALRFGQFYAPDSSHSQTMLKTARRGWAALPGASDAYFPMVAADDAAAAVVAALEVPAGTYNVVEDEPLTRAETAAALAGALGATRLRPAPRLLTRAAAKRAPNLVTSQRVANRAFRAVAAWRPAYPSFREGVATLVPQPARRAETRS